MGNKKNKNPVDPIQRKLNRTAKKPLKSRRDIKKALKKAAEFEEIRKILASTEFDTDASDSPTESTIIDPFESCLIPNSPPGKTVFKEELCFSLFNEKSLYLKNFIDDQEKFLVFGEGHPIPSEECFRKLILHRTVEILMPQEIKCSVSLYVLYLMSVHEEFAFVDACFDFLKYCPFRLHIKDIFPIFINFGIDREYFDFHEESLLQKFSYSQEDYQSPENPKFPKFNVEMVGKILLYYICNNFIEISVEIKFLVKALAKIVLDPKVRSSSLLGPFSIILSVLCQKIKENFELKEIVNWMILDEEHLLNQLDICGSISKNIFPDLYDTIFLKIICNILKYEKLPAKSPIKIDLIKFVLAEVTDKELTVLEMFTLLQLINNALPGMTVTVDDFKRITSIMVCLENKVPGDPIDLIRLQREIAKIKLLIGTDIRYDDCHAFYSGGGESSKK